MVMGRAKVVTSLLAWVAVLCQSVNISNTPSFASGWIVQREGAMEWSLQCGASLGCGMRVF